MNIILDKNAGFCFGVERAIDKVFQLINSNSQMNIYTFGPLIHNNDVIKILKERNINTITDLETIKDEDCLIVLRAHGVSKDIYDYLYINNIKFKDYTCPYVINIHKIVKKHYEEDYSIIIVGNKNHPEVIGINGWCNNTANIIDNEKVVDKLPNYDKICLVAQTTITKELWDSVVYDISNKYHNCAIFNTICKATEERQKSASDLAKVVDCMIVIGSKKSSNTCNLYEICSKNCKNVYHIENMAGLPLDNVKYYNKIGITAGASTPNWIIKEVITRMDEQTMQNQEQMMEEYEKSMKTLYTGDTVTGTVIMVTDEEVMVNIGYKSDGIIKKDDFTWEVDMSLKDAIKDGDEIEVKVVNINDGEGNVVLSKKMVDADKNWYKIEYAYNEKTPLEGYVKNIVKGGGIVEVFGIRAFMPASQFELRYTDDLSGFVNTKVKGMVLEYDKEKRKVVLSRKECLKIEKSKLEAETWDKIEEGQKIQGEVKRLADFGAFVDIGGVDGLIHISELSWNRVKHPSEIVKEGQKVEVVVLSLDRDKRKISLGLKQITPDPWTLVSEKYNIGDIIEVKVLRLADFGAFVEVESGVDGLVHISQIADRRISKPAEVLEIGQKINAKIMDVKAEEKKISLSIKEAAYAENVEEEAVTDCGCCCSETETCCDKDSDCQ